MACGYCSHWCTAKVRRYSDGAEVVVWVEADGKGRCDSLGIVTESDFHCSRHLARETGDPIEIETIVGAPWEHYVWVACPECAGVGSENNRPCRLCVGTGKARRYDDGVTTGQRDYDHPLEKERKKALGIKDPIQIGLTIKRQPMSKDVAATGNANPDHPGLANAL